MYPVIIVFSEIKNVEQGMS